MKPKEETAIERHRESSSYSSTLFLLFHFNITLLSMPRSSKQALPLTFSEKKYAYAFVISFMRATCPVHLIFLKFIALIVSNNNFHF
jgi:hypothetical protein